MKEQAVSLEVIRTKDNRLAAIILERTSGQKIYGIHTKQELKRLGEACLSVSEEMVDARD